MLLWTCPVLEHHSLFLSKQFPKLFLRDSLPCMQVWEWMSESKQLDQGPHVRGAHSFIHSACNWQVCVQEREC